MADTKISALTAASAAAAANEIPINEAGTTKKITVGQLTTLTGGLRNYSTAAQSISAASRTFITGSQIVVPADGLKVGTILRWTITATKTAAGTAASTYDICFGTAGTTADTARVSFTKPAGTAAADEGTIVITAVVRSIGASGVVVGNFNMSHNLASTGHLVIPAAVVTTISSAFDTTYAAASSVGICATTGASDAITVQMVTAEAYNL